MWLERRDYRTKYRWRTGWNAVLENQTAWPAKRWSMAGWDGFRRGGRVREAEAEGATKGVTSRTG